jgi:hypothetical protein
VIAKLVPNPQKSASTATRVVALSDYIRKTVVHSVRDKCVHSGALHFIAREPLGQTAEMIALATESIRCLDPVKHFVLSWPSDERPTPAQADEAAKIFTASIGLEGHQCLYGMHVDTDNVHLHLLINRINPETGRATLINSGWEIKAAHQALPLIEAAQGWKAERGALYQLDASGKVVRTAEPDPDAPLRPSTRARNFEAVTGAQSAERIAQEHASPILRSAPTWEAVHEQLAALGIRYEAAGSGAKIWVGEVPIKASRADRQGSMGAMERRLGSFKPAPEAALAKAKELAPSTNKPLEPAMAQFVEGRRQYEARRKERRKQMLEKHRGEREGLAKEQKAERLRVISGRSWRGQGHALNAMRAILAAEQRVAREAKILAHREERQTVAKRWPALGSIEPLLAHERKVLKAKQVAQQVEGNVPQPTLVPEVHQNLERANPPKPERAVPLSIQPTPAQDDFGCANDEQVRRFLDQQRGASR